MHKSIGLGIVGALIATPTLAAKPQIQWNEDYDFSSVQTFMWQDSAGQSLAQSQPFLHEHIVNALEYQLTKSGLREVESGADIVVTYYGSTETEVQLRSDSYGYGFGGYGMGGWGYYGYGMGGPVSTTTRVYEYQRGTLIVDIFDPGTMELVWRGSIGDITISDSMEKTQKYIDKAIVKMAEQSRKLREKAARE